MKQQESEDLYLLLNSSIRSYYLRTHELLEEIGLYPGQPRVLHALWKSDGLSQKEIAKQLNVKPSTVNVMIRRMEKANLVKRVKDKTDLRVSKVYLKQKGIDLKEDIKEIGRKFNEEVFYGFNEEEKQSIIMFLNKINNNLKKSSF